MPEGHSIHRLAHAFTELFGGQELQVSSPQGRFASGAALLNGRVLQVAEAKGKHLFLGFGAATEAGAATEDEADSAVQPEELPAHLTQSWQWLHVHLGLYGSWTFAGDDSFEAPHAIGAPRRRVDDTGTALADEWRPPAPHGAVRVRIQGQHGLADLTGPTRCEVITPAEQAAVLDRLGPDPLRPEAAKAVFIANMRASRRSVAELLMDQQVISGVGNIFRAETLFRIGISPRRRGAYTSATRLGRIWDDLVRTMTLGVTTGHIVTILPEDDLGQTGQQQSPAPDATETGEAGLAEATSPRFYVYQRTGMPCLRCGRAIKETQLAGRRLFWCPGCQRS